MTSSSPAEQFDYSQPFSMDTGRAAVTAPEPQGRGYPGCFGGEVTAGLARPELERAAIGLVAAGILRRGGWRR